MWKKIKNFCYWGWKLRNSEDWDYNFLYEVIYLKMSKMVKTLQNNDIARWTDENTKTMRKLRTATECMRRLYESNYCEKVKEDFDKKWGEVEVNHSPYSIEGFFVVETTRANVVTEEDEERKSKELNRIFERENYLMAQDLEMFCELFRKYSRYWWD